MPIPPFKKKPSGPKGLSLALQGGGAHGAFEWGVLDRLLEEDDLEIRAVTAASAGAMNAVCLAQGLMDDGRAGAQARLESFWRNVNRAGGRNVFGDTGIWTNVFGGGVDWLKNTPGWRMAETLALSLSPYEYNPFNLNPLHDVLEGEITFSRIRGACPIKLYISATQIRTSKSKVFRETELTSHHIMASACLPQLFQAVEIDGEPYWDGGFLANPPLWPLFYDDTPDDILIVTLNPFVREETPKSPGEIMDRLNEITFNASLASELRAIGFVQKLLDEGLLKDTARGRYRRMLVHAITADKPLADLSMSTKFNTEWSFLTDLKDRGRAAAQAWLDDCGDCVGVKSSVDLKVGFP
ncbi:patatin-like phospholipase family protein [Caulobacter vibrioides]|uniref:Patatin-like phospholipase family protein n=1 Tax=Caulobacter vibrioides TaxID=155892 RepID=A0A290MPL7_CAUVI|nr:patatin-like phospholipase family protein [Caulobacter vibrioides]ATC33961.1 patatin-like phospholipase family protein [Caulobacter vibrioides]